MVFPLGRKPGVSTVDWVERLVGSSPDFTLYYLVFILLDFLLWFLPHQTPAVVVQSPSPVWFFVTPWTGPHFPGLHRPPEFAQTHVHRVGDANQPSHPLSSLLFLPSLFSNIRVFSNESALRIRWPKYRSFSFSPSNEYSGLISFRMDWLDLLAVQGTLKSLLQHHSSKASILHCSALY